jgi:signal transduction histidine kinase
MFNPIRRNLTILFTASFFLFLLVILILIYTLIFNAMEQQQREELEEHYTTQQHDLMEHTDDENQTISYDPNRSYFYYVFNVEKEIIHGDEQFKGFFNTLKSHLPETLEKSRMAKIEWQQEHLLLLYQPVKSMEQPLGFIVVGQSITDQYHFFQRILWIFIIMLLIATVLLSVLSYYLAGKAMKPIEASFTKQKRFVSDASHELRTPLSIFFSSLELLESEDKEHLSPLSQEVLDDLKSEALSMKELLEDLLFLARNDQREFSLKRENFSLTDLVYSISRKFSRILPAAIQLNTNIEQNIQMYGDKNRIQELFYILLDNAIRYTKDGAISLSLEKAGNNMIITVQDSGVGINEKDLQRIFERFYRGDAARAGSGTGLGLSIAKSIVDLHHGTIKVKSEIGKGTIFFITIPMEK